MMVVRSTGAAIAAEGRVTEISARPTGSGENRVGSVMQVVSVRVDRIVEVRLCQVWRMGDPSIATR